MTRHHVDRTATDAHERPQQRTAAEVSMAEVQSDHSTRSSGAGRDHVISACTLAPACSRVLITAASIFFIKKLRPFSRIGGEEGEVQREDSRQKIKGFQPDRRDGSDSSTKDGTDTKKGGSFLTLSNENLRCWLVAMPFNLGQRLASHATRCGVTHLV